MASLISNYAVVLMPVPVERDLITLALLRLGFHAIPCKDIIAAEEAIERQPVDLLIVDVILPGANGLDLVMEWKNKGKIEHCKVIVYSAMRFPEYVSRAKLAGVVDFLIKPVELDVILNRAMKWLKKNDYRQSTKNL